MASIFLDKQSQSWKIKVKDNGKDKRVTLRKAAVGETASPIPDDVLGIAQQRGFTVQAVKDAGEPHAETALVPFLDRYERAYGTTHRPTSVDALDGVLRPFRRFCRENNLADIRQVKRQQIMAYFHWRHALIDPRLKKQVKPQTVIQQIRSLLSPLFNSAVDDDLIEINPCHKTLRQLHKAFPPAAQKTKYLDPAQLKKFLENLDRGVKDGTIPLDYADLAMVMLATGLRVSAAIQMDSAIVPSVPGSDNPCRHDHRHPATW